MQSMRILGIDYGTKRVGIAITDAGGTLAFPHAVLPNDKYLIEALKKLRDEHGISAIVLGESKDYSGKHNPVMEHITTFRKVLEEQVAVPVHAEPEFLTSAEAERVQGKHNMHDASAAAIILQSYIDKRSEK
jgi:putative holliday junction resolvase